MLLHIVWNRTSLIFIHLCKASSGHLYHVYKAHEFLIFTDRKLERSYGLTKLLFQVQNQLSEGSLVIIHIADKEKSGKGIGFAEFPGPYRSRLNPRLTVYYDNRRIRRRNSLFHLSNKVEVSGSIQNVHLQLSGLSLILDRNYGSGNGKLPLLFFFIKVRQGVPVINTAHSINSRSYIS